MAGVVLSFLVAVADAWVLLIRSTGERDHGSTHLFTERTRRFIPGNRASGISISWNLATLTKARWDKGREELFP